MVWKCILSACVCGVCVPTGLQDSHTHTRMPGECFTVTTLLTALLLEKRVFGVC